MGLFDKLKQKAQDAIKSVAPTAAAPADRAEADEADEAPVAHARAAARPQASGPSFEWDGDRYPQPEGWSGLAMEDWFFKLEQTRDRLMHADEEALEPMEDEDGDALDAEEVLLITLGFQNGSHWEAFRGWGVATWAAQTGESPTDVEFRMGGIAREKLLAQKAGAMGGAGGLLEPVEGVSVEQWAQIQAALAGGQSVEGLLERARVDRPRWERVSAEWTARMQRDTSFAITTVYSNAFAGAAQGPYGAQAAQAAAAGVGGNVGAEPVPFERYVEIQEAMSAASDRGQDPSALLASFGIRPVDWSNIGMFWSKRIQQEATKYHQLYTQYADKYRAKYRR